MAQNNPVLVAAFYRFAPLQNLQNLREELQQLGGDQGVLGTVLLAAEGVNGTVCGKAEAVTALLDRLRLEAGFEALQDYVGMREGLYLLARVYNELPGREEDRNFAAERFVKVDRLINRAHVKGVEELHSLHNISGLEKMVEELKH